MSLSKAIEHAYSTMVKRGWDTIYWAIDLHGVCIESNYQVGVYNWTNQDAVKALRLISSLPESKIIIWSGLHEKEYQPIKDFFEAEEIFIDYFNCNPESENTYTGNFEKKFYFSILLDDKAGFDPNEDWEIVYNTTKQQHLMARQHLGLS